MQDELFTKYEEIKLSAEKKEIFLARISCAIKKDIPFLYFAVRDKHDEQKIYSNEESKLPNEESKFARGVAFHKGKIIPLTFSCMMVETGPSREQGEEENPYPSQPSGKNYEALSEDPSRLQQLTQRVGAGANTRLKLAATSRVATIESGREQNLMLHSPLDLEDGEEEDAGDKDLVTIEKLIRRIEERDNRIDQMANQMNTMMDAMNTLLQQQQQQQQQPQAHHQSARQSQLTEQAADANPRSMERQGPPYQQNPTANEPTTSHEVPILSMTLSAFQQLIDNIVTSKIKQLYQDKKTLLTEGDKPYPT